MYRSIVVPVDHTEQWSMAVIHGGVVAHQTGATLELVTVKPTYVDHATVRAHLADIATRHRLDAVLRVAPPGDVTRILVDIADQPDTLMCLDTRARGPVSELVLGSVSEQVVRRSRRPLLLVGPRCGPAPDRYDAMVVALDGSALAEEILPVVADWSRQLDVTPWLFEVLEAQVPFELGSDDVHESAYVHRVADRLLRQGVKAEWDVTHDRHPATAIVRQAESRRPSLIALTTHGHSGLGRVVLGGVALQVAHRAQVPVLILRPRDASRGDGG